MLSTSLVFTTDRPFAKNHNIKFSAKTYYGPHAGRVISYAERLNDLWPLLISEFHIKHTPIVRFTNLKRFGVFGICYGFDMDTPSMIMMDTRPEKTDDFDSFLKDLCHEMTHAEQWSRGDMTKNADYEYFWKGQHITASTDSLLSLTQEEYKSLPWEAEAYARQELAYESIINQMHF